MATAQTGSGDIATFVLKVAGSVVPEYYNIYSVYVEKKVNSIAMAKIVILDGDASTGSFAASSSAVFVPGAGITIEAGYNGNNQVIFKGIVTGQSIRINETIGSSLEVECHDEAIKMTVGRKSFTYSQKKDSEIIEAIIAAYAGLSADITATLTVWPGQVQYYVTDWDYILSLAAANGFIITALNGKISVTTPDTDTSPVLTVTYGDGIYEFNGRLNAVTQLGNVQASAWNYKDQVINNGQAMPTVTGAGNLSTKKLSETIGLSTYDLKTTAPLETADLINWAKAQMVKSEFSKITAEVKIQGTSLADPAKYITLAGLGDRFNGDHFISGVVHNLADGNWFTEVTIGIPQAYFTNQHDVMAPPASGLLPGARGLFNGTVKKVFDDPDMQYRILVDVPMFDTNGAGLWARLSNFYSTNNAGAFFLPEAGDEVVLGFLNEDPRFPVILGSMYSSSKLKPFAGLDPDEKNQYKAITSRSGITVQFDDVNKMLTCATPDKNCIILSDQDKKITVQDQHGNSIIMSESGITMNSPGDINITADQNINISGKTGIKIGSAGGDIEISGINIKETADVQYSANGNATAQVNGGAELTLKGAMVMIN